MRFSSVAAALAAAPVVVSAAYSNPFPLSNGFPNVKSSEMSLIYKNAGGPLPNSALPKKLSPTAVQVFSVVALQEILEVAFFSDFLMKLSAHAPGYVVGDDESFTQMDLYEDLFSIRAQEELHALGANAILMTAGETPQEPCKYSFPVNDYKSAITLIQTITDVVIGVLPTAQELFGMDGGDEVGLTPLIGAIIGQEAEQVGAFRFWQGKKPSAAPFITGGAIQFAWSAAQMFIEPGSCPKSHLVTIPALPTISLESTPAPKDMTLKMTVKGVPDPKTMDFFYFSGQNVPLASPIMDMTTKDGMSTFSVSFPYVSKGFSRGLTIGAIAMKGKYASITDVGDVAKFGPALIEVD